MRISLTLIDFLILALALQGLVLSGMLLYSSKKIKSDRWLAAFVFLLSYSCISMEIFWSDLPNKYPLIYVPILPLRMALGPILYFYTRSLLYGYKKLKRRDYLHFCALFFEMGPQIAFVFHYSGLLSIPAIRNWYFPFEKQIFLFESGNSGNLPFFISFAIYSALCFKILRNNRFSPEISAYKLKDIKWLKTLLNIIGGVTLIWCISLFLAYLPFPQMAGWIKYMMMVIAIGFAYWLGMSAYIRQSIMSAGDVLEYNKIPVKMHFPADEANKYHQQLIALMEAEQLYLNPGLKLDLLADKMGVSEKMISSLLNQHIGKNFNDFVNEYRIEDAKNRLLNPAFRQFTIAAIAFDCGFNSLATFQRCFKQITGITPSQYQNGIKPVSLQTNTTQIGI